MKFFKSKSEAFFLVGIAMSTFSVGVFLIYAGVNWYSFGNPLRRLELQTVSCSTNCLSRIVGDDYVILLTSARGVIHVVPFDRPWDYDCSVARLVEERLIPSKLNGNGRFYVLIGMHVDVHRAAYILDWLAENYSGRVYVVAGTADVSRTMIGGCYKVSSGEDLNEPQFVPVCLADLNSLSRFCKLLGNRIVYDVRRLLFGENNFTIFTYECPKSPEGLTRVRYAEQNSVELNERGACRAGSRPQADIDEAKRSPQPMCASLAGRTGKR